MHMDFAYSCVRAHAENPELSLAFKVTKQGIELMEPRLPRLNGIRSRTFSAASALLFELMHRGVYLVPQARDAAAASLGMKVSRQSTQLHSAASLHVKGS